MNVNHKMLVLTAMAAISVSAMAQNQWDVPLHIYEQKEVVDTTRADSILNAYHAELRAKLIEAQTRPWVDEIAVINRLIEYEASGGKIVEDDVWLYLQRKSRARKLEKDEKTIGKRKVPKGFADEVLLPRKEKLQAYTDGYSPWMPSWDDVFYRHMTRYEYNDPERGTSYVFMDRVALPKKMVSVPKPNPACRDNYFNGTFARKKVNNWGMENNFTPYQEYENGRWDEAQQSQGWEWTDGKDLVNKGTYYPEAISFRQHPDHPEYRIKCNKSDNSCWHPNVYDEKGILVRAGNIVGPGQRYEKIVEDVMLAICKRDFLANKYDINSAKPETLAALRIKFGIEDGVDARFKKYAKMAQEARDEIVSATTLDQYISAKKKQREALNVLLEYVAKEREPQAMNYLAQLEDDHEVELSYLYKVERIDNVTFKLYFLNDKMECGCIALMKWRNKEPYEAEYEIELQPCETITIRK